MKNPEQDLLVLFSPVRSLSTSFPISKGALVGMACFIYPKILPLTFLKVIHIDGGISLIKRHPGITLLMNNYNHMQDHLQVSLPRHVHLGYHHWHIGDYNLSTYFEHISYHTNQILVPRC